MTCAQTGLDRYAPGGYIKVMPAPKELRFNMAMNPDELNMLADLAERNGISESGTVRLLIRRAYAERSGNRKPAPRVRRRAGASKGAR